MKIALIVGLLWSVNSQAGIASLSMAGGDGVGNGGDVIVCNDGTHELLDLYEARVLRGLEFDSSLVGADAETTAKNILARLSVLDARAAKLYGEKVDEFRANARFVPNANLVDIPDSNQMVMPRDCELRQAAIQRKPQFPEEKFYLIDKTIWDHLPVKDQAALMLHEIIYTDTIERGQRNSIRARYYNSYISAQGFSGLTPDDYRAIKERSGLANFWILRPQKLLFVYIDQNMDYLERSELACQSLGFQVVFYKNDKEIFDNYYSIGNAIYAEFGADKEIDASYYGTNGRGETKLLGATFQFKGFYGTGSGESAAYAICRKDKL